MIKSIRTTTNPTWCPGYNQKTYKSLITIKNRMFPSNPSGLLDVLFNLDPRCYSREYAGFYILFGGFL